MDFEARQRIRRASAFDWRKSGRNADEYPKSVGTGISFRAIYNACSTTCLRHAEDSHVSVIETNDLRKRYRRIQALKGVSLKVEKGEIYGLLGQNGAGKTTLIKILLGIVRITSGEAELLNAPAGTTNIRERVGYLPEDHQFPGYHTGYSLMDFYGQLYGVSRNDRRTKIPETLEEVGIAGRMNSKI